MTPISVIHAALLHTGKVLFIADAYSPNTVIWDPEDPVAATAFRLLDGTTTGLTRTVGGVTVNDRLACAGHSFLSDGKLLAVGGDQPTRATAWKFDPATERWEPAGTMAKDVSIGTALQQSKCLVLSARHTSAPPSRYPAAAPRAGRPSSGVQGLEKIGLAPGRPDR